MAGPLLIHAPAKLNLCLYLGPTRADGLHELCSLFEPLALSDLIEVTKASGPGAGGRVGDEGASGPVGEGGEAGGDVVLCPGIEGDNLVARALAVLRAQGWEHPPVRVEVEKRIPVAAGLGGGSADAAAILRLAGAPGEDDGRAEGEGWALDLGGLAARLGADVPSQLVPSLALVRGAGERVERLPDPEPHAVVLLPGGGGLSTPKVFAEADRQGLGRDTAELDDLAGRLRGAAGAGSSPLEYAELLVNDLEPAARRLRPDIGGALDALRGAGAPLALLTGSGPTACGLFPDIASAKRAAARLDRDDAIVCKAGRAP